MPLDITIPSDDIPVIGIPEIIRDTREAINDLEDSLPALPDIPSLSEILALYVSGLTSVSLTSVTIAQEDKTFNIATGKLFGIGQAIIITSTANPSTHWMWGQVKSYDSDTGILIVDVQSSLGSGTIANWTINLSPNPYTADLSIREWVSVNMGQFLPGSNAVIRDIAGKWLAIGMDDGILAGATGNIIHDFNHLLDGYITAFEYCFTTTGTAGGNVVILFSITVVTGSETLDHYDYSVTFTAAMSGQYVQTKTLQALPFGIRFKQGDALYVHFQRQGSAVEDTATDPLYFNGLRLKYVQDNI